MKLFDAHCDTALELWLRGEGLLENTCHIDLQKARAFSAYAQVFAFCSYAGQTDGAPCTQEEFLTLPLKKLREEVGKNHAAFAASRVEVLRTIAEGRTAVLLSVEGPEVIGCDAARLAELDGFVMSTLTWNADNALAGCHLSDKGLTARGLDYVRTAQARDILIDVSHLGERAFWDLVDITYAPILASHSNCRALCNHTRNLTDDQLRAIADTGGAVGLNLYPPFLGENADFSTLFAHLEHILTLCGETHVILGGDLDGCATLARGFSDLSDYAAFYTYLQSRGYGDTLLNSIFFDNLLLLLRKEGD